MKTPLRLLVTVLSAFTLFFSGCSGGDSHEKLADDMSKQVDRMIAAMSSVTDKASAEKAVAEVKSVTEELKKLAARTKALGKPSAETKAKIEAKMKTKQDEVQQKMAASQAAMMKAGPEAMGIMMNGMMELGPAMIEVGKAFDSADK